MYGNQQIIHQYHQFIKQTGYKYSKDDLGFYFDNGKNKFSIMKSGPSFICYFNVRENNDWILKSKSHMMLQFDEGLRWVLTNIQKNAN
ncbi:MAG: hypothetical protein ACOCP8_04030 [archaeon]